MSTTPTLRPETPLTGPMALLAGGVPLSLLLDLALGPDSEELLWTERSTPATPPRPRS